MPKRIFEIFKNNFEPSKYIEGIFYTVFDHEKGPTISIQIPTKIIKSGDFCKLCHLIILHPIKFLNILTINYHNNLILGCPIVILDCKYPRNCFSFNICFVIKSKISFENLEM